MRKEIETSMLFFIGILQIFLIKRHRKIFIFSSVPFNNGDYSAKQAFALIQPDSIICDDGKIDVICLISFNEFDEHDSEFLS